MEMVSSLLKHATTRWHNIQHLQKIQYFVLGVTDQMFKHIPEFEAMSSEIFFIIFPFWFNIPDILRKVLKNVF